MAITYKSPGVFSEDVVIRAKSSLPTGVPCFIGFADEAGDETVKVRVPVKGDSVGTSFPVLQDPNRVWFDQDDECLVCCGPMSSAMYKNSLLLLASEAEGALKELYQLSRKKFKIPVILNRKEDFQSGFKSLPLDQSFLWDAVNGFFDNGGVYCYVLCADTTIDPKEALIKALDDCAKLTDIDLVAVPDCMILNCVDEILEVQRNVLAHCVSLGNRFAILDSLGLKYKADSDSVADFLDKKQRREIVKVISPDLQITAESATGGAVYFPWVYTLSRPDEPVPPCGHIAGIYSRSDRNGWVSRAPANEEILGIIDLSYDVTTGLQDQLNPIGINCLRAFPGRGIRVWGARTLSQDQSWLYINVRRLVLTVSRWIDANLCWAAFEPNTPMLWIRISRELSVYLEKLWRAGALAGSKADQAFFVKCDTETNPAETREAGQVVTQIGLAPMVPSEFIIVRVTHRAGTTEIN